MPRRSEISARVRPDLPRPPHNPAESVAWAILQCPPAFELSEWLARLMPEGIWSDCEGDAIADAIVGAAIRAQDEDPDGDEAGS